MHLEFSSFSFHRSSGMESRKTIAAVLSLGDEWLLKVLLCFRGLGQVYFLLQKQQHSWSHTRVSRMALMLRAGKSDSSGQIRRFRI